MEEFVYYNSLFDIYGELLTKKEQMTFKDYYHEDLSLSEIADNNNISRSAVQKTIKTVLDKLSYYEEKLHVSESKNKLVELLNCDDLDTVKARIRSVLE